jgi:hypothetical protein
MAIHKATRQVHFSVWICTQGEQIGRILACWVICFLWANFFKLRNLSRKFGLHFIRRKKAMQQLRQNLGWATFWATKNHLVTLVASMVEGQLGYLLELKKQDMELSIRALQLI